MGLFSATLAPDALDHAAVRRRGALRPAHAMNGAQDAPLNVVGVAFQRIVNGPLTQEERKRANAKRQRGARQNVEDSPGSVGVDDLKKSCRSSSQTLRTSAMVVLIG